MLYPKISGISAVFQVFGELFSASTPGVVGICCVNVKRHLCRFVSEVVLDGFHVCAGSQRGDGIGMAQIMRVQIRLADSRSGGFHCVVYSPRAVCAAVRPSENEVGGDFVVLPFAG